MKLLIISDVHGDYKSLEKVLKNESFDRLVVLGDLFSYGKIILDLNNNEIIKLLKKYKDKLILIRGNCDYFIDYEKIGLYANDIITIKANNYDITFTHGNRYYRGFMPDFYGDIFVSGHTHIPMILKEKHTIYANPGSIGLPRGGSQKSYMVFNDNYIELKTIDGVLEKKINL